MCQLTATWPCGAPGGGLRCPAWVWAEAPDGAPGRRASKLHKYTLNSS